MAVLLAAYAGVSVAFFVEPTLGAVAHPQAVVVLRGYGGRVTRAFAIARAQYTQTVAVSFPPCTSCPAPQPGLRIRCFVPRPPTTQGEARAVARLARIHQWNRLVVVAGTTQVVRARVYLEHYYAGRVAFSGVDPVGFSSWLYQIAYGQIGFLKALVCPGGC
ncbi:MAG: YdcF family protein [Acidimicrobiales bacterium]